MGRRHEEKVDVEELARLENPEDGSSTKIRVKMPNRRINEMFALADQILGGNLDKVINAYNSETFDNELYEEIVGCYRALSLQILHASEIIEKNKGSWSDVKTNSINTLKRMLRAG